jgi:hypothetical protein
LASASPPLNVPREIATIDIASLLDEELSPPHTALFDPIIRGAHSFFGG